MASSRKQYQEEVRFRVMRVLNENPEVSTREIASIVGISNGAAYYCITALIEKGLVKLGNFGSSNQKRKYSYILTPKGIREKSFLTYRFLERKRNEYQLLKNEIELLEREAGELTHGDPRAGNASPRSFSK